LLKYLKVDQADIFGFSNGAGVALQVAIRHPAMVHKLVFASYMTKRSDAAPQFWAFMHQAKFSNMPQPLKDAFLKVNPDEGKLRKMCAKDINRMLHFTDVPDRDLKDIHAPTLVLQGDRDVPRPEASVKLAREIPGASLVILPGGHGEYLGELLTMKQGSHAPEFTAGIIDEFLRSQ
jgi:pimeloyl-ACP methyl ester carboxylesterase